MKRFLSLLCGCAWAGAALMACTPKPQASPPPAHFEPLQVIWSGTSGGYDVSWTSREISAQRSGAKSAAPAFSETGLTIADFSDISSRKTGDCDFKRVATVLSLVGPWLSLEHADELHCGQGGEPTLRHSALTIDLARPRERPQLTRIIPSAKTAISAALTSARNACHGGAPADFLNRFAFVQLRGAQIQVRFGLPADCSAADVTAWLPVPPARSAWFIAAAHKTRGFLMADQATVARGRGTTILYHVHTASSSR
ncbi:MAG: hypothetical protein M3Z37_01475 [Candidatus Eremiobacteraeota bacterium]|nr:hypothetical protein [Candidatus Eremiobacteraeota bacterium]